MMLLQQHTCSAYLHCVQLIIMEGKETSPELSTVMPNGEAVPGGGVMNHQVASKFFALRGDNFEKAVEDVKLREMKAEIDGNFIGSWLLTQISYWNSDKERLIVLCENVLIICKYDFVATRIVSVVRIYLKSVKQMQEGAFSFPDNSVSMARLYRGLRLSWGSINDQPWYQKWNPLNSEIPMATFTSHPVFFLPDLESKERYDIRCLVQSLKFAFEKFPAVVIKEDEPIVIESYAGLFSHLHNQSRLGFSRERGGISF